MKMLSQLILLSIGILASTGSSVSAWQSDTVPADTATVIRDDLQMTVNVPGVFVADDKDEIKIEPLQYEGDLIVTKIIDEGASVDVGDLLIGFDTDKLDEAIDDAKNEVTDASVEVKKANAEYQSALIELESQLVHLKTEREFLEREVNEAKTQQVLTLAEKEKDIADSEQRLADTREDFNTLKEVYSERGMETSSTSGSILFERERNKIDNAIKSIEVQKRELAYFQAFDKSKTQIEKELEVVKKQAEISKQKVVLEADVAEKKSAVDKTQRQLDVANKKVEELIGDRNDLQVISPRKGTVFYGTTENEVPAGVIIGGMPDVRDQLRIGGRVSTHSVLMTVATMKNLSIKMSLLENDIQHIRNGLAITVYPDAYPSQQFQGSLTEVARIATKIGFFANSDRRFKVMGKCTDKAPQLRSGMNCRVTIHPEVISNALQVPIVAVFEEDEKYWCFVEGQSNEKREVEIGYCNADFVQITSGLEEGEVVLLNDPNKGKR